MHASQRRRSRTVRPGDSALRGALALLVAAAVAGCFRARDDAADARVAEAATTPAAREVRPGIEVLLSDSVHLVAGRRVGLVTNHTGVDRLGRSDIDLLHEHPDVELVAVFAPEHGLRGDADPGEAVEDGRDARTGVPVFSLYGRVRKPTPEMLDGVDVLLIDYQEVGARYWTYASTMTLAMEAAGERGIPAVVLDRPNPIGGAVQGNVLDPTFATFVGRFPVAMRHGMTPGELARYYAGEFGIAVELHVVPIDGWRHDLPFEDTGLPWLAPSPNMPDRVSALHYPGTCLFEGTNLSVARGTDRPFQQIGAPWLDGQALARAMRAYDLPGVRFEPVRFTPHGPGDGKSDGVEVEGVRLIATGPDYDPTRTAVALLVEARRQAGDRWRWLQAHFDRLAGTDRLRLGIEAGLPPEALTADWDAQLDAFRRARARYLLYP
ncbi:MAG: DUF1343 domain-containing protein [Gemmatimonadetes bacterium]|nr:MAG: DUF1343 domain-containing protein [Gemmatimonadota bacterium]